MNIAVLVKLVPDSETRIELQDGKVKDDAFKYILNPYDEFALEQAVQLKEAHGGKVTIVSLFGQGGDTELKKALAIGADGALVLRQPDYRGDRPAANAALLAEALAGLAPDLVLGGLQSIDFYQAATVPMVAHKLDWPHVAAVQKLDVEGDKLTAQRQIEGGVQTVEVALPALITCQKDLVKVRFPALRDIMMAKRKPFENRDVAEAGAGDLLPTAAELPLARAGGRLIEGETVAEKVEELVNLLKTEAKVL